MSTISGLVNQIYEKAKELNIPVSEYLGDDEDVQIFALQHFLNNMEDILLEEENDTLTEWIDSVDFPQV